MITPDEAREQAVKRAQESVAGGEPMAWFEELYNFANGDNSKIPWADGIPNPYLILRSFWGEPLESFPDAASRLQHLTSPRLLSNGARSFIPNQVSATSLLIFLICLKN